MKVFEIAAPDGRRVRHPPTALDADAYAKTLQAGYTVAGEVIGAGADLSGGWVVPAGQGESPLAVLLRLYGADMRDWLRTQGFVKPDP